LTALPIRSKLFMKPLGLYRSGLKIVGIPEQES